MLTAHKKEAPLFDVAGVAQAHPLSGILDSIRGLRILLDDISLDDIIEADEQAHKLTQRLDDFHRDLTNLSHIRKLVSEAKELTERIEAPFDLGRFAEANENTKKLVERLSAFYNDLTNLSHIQNLLVRAKDISPPTEAISRAGKREYPQRLAETHSGTLPNNLILFPTPVKNAREMIRIPASTRASTPFFPKETEELLGDDELRRPDPLEKIPYLPESADQVAPEGPQPNDFIASTDPKNHSQSFEQVEEWSLEQKDSPAELLSPNDDSLISQSGTVGNNRSTTPSDQSERDQTRDTLVDHKTSHATETPPHAKAKKASNLDYRLASETMTVHFDQKLLTDLIKDYGEFVTYSNLPPPKVQEKVIAPDPEFMRQPANDFSDRLEPKTQPKPVPYRNEGDLDRTLKKLIKDYGEYDIYSHRNPNNLKKVVIATSTLLVLLLSLSFFYFRHTTDPSSKLSPTPAEAFSVKTAPNASTRTAPKPTKNDHLNDPGSSSRLPDASGGMMSVFSAAETSIFNNKKE